MGFDSDTMVTAIDHIDPRYLLFLVTLELLVYIQRGVD